MRVERGSKTYYFIRNTRTRDADCIEHFETICYAYDYFEKLMLKLKECASDKGFWYNRNIILRLAPKLVIVVEGETNDIAAFYILQDSGEIVFFQVFHERQGIGRWLIERERENMPVSLYVHDVTVESTLFWQKVGVPLWRSVH